MHEWTFVLTDSIAQRSAVIILSWQFPGTHTDISLEALISVDQLAHVVTQPLPWSCRRLSTYRVKVWCWERMSIILGVTHQIIISITWQRVTKTTHVTNTYAHLTFLPHAIFSHYSGLETGVSVCACVCLCVYADVLTQPSQALSRSVFVFLTSGPVCYVCMRACVYVYCRRPVTAEEEDCICGGTAWLQRGVEILREA